MGAIKCDSCGLPMHVTKKGKTKKHKRMRRFHCDICDVSTTIIGNGFRDMVLLPLRAIKLAGNINSIKEENQILKELIKYK